jgi:hypothetical protein
MTNINTFGIFKLNQLLFLEAGFIHLNTILTGVFIPLFGLSFFFVSVATYLIFCFMASMMKQYEREYEDFFDVISSDSFPSAGKNVLAGFALAVITTPVLLFYNQEFIAYPYNSALCTVFSSILGGLAYALINKDSKSIVVISFFSLVSIPLVLASLVIGSVLTLPLLFIFLYRRIQHAE